MRWAIVKLNQDARGMRGRPGEVETVEADELTIDGGALVFRTGGLVVTARGPGAWAEVAALPDNPDPNVTHPLP